MLIYRTIGPDKDGDFLIGYPTPGATQIFTVAGTASSEQGAKDECTRRNESQVARRRASMVRSANMIARDVCIDQAKAHV